MQQASFPMVRSSDVMRLPTGNLPQLLEPHKCPLPLKKAPSTLLGKFAVAGSFAVAFLYATELLPTQVRYAHADSV